MTKTVAIDTSIQIARFVHSPEVKSRIRETLTDFDLVLTTSVVKQEFIRRFILEARYLLKQFELRGSFQKVMRHVNDVLPPQQGRKRQICLQTLQVVLESEEPDLTDRAKIFLKTLVRDGVAEFESLVDAVISQPGCRLSYFPIKMKRTRLKHCSRVDDCQIDALFRDNKRAEEVAQYLATVPAESKSSEIQNAEEFLADVSRGTNASELNPCLSVGDLTIALESAAVSYFYTFNRRESQHLCPALGQTMIVASVNPQKPDEIVPGTE